MKPRLCYVNSYLSDVREKKRPATPQDVWHNQSGHVHSKELSFSYQSHSKPTVVVERARNITSVFSVFIHLLCFSTGSMYLLL